MPTISAEDLVDLRLNDHVCIPYLVAYQPAIIWSAQVNGNHAYGDTTIAVKGASLVETPFEHAIVQFGTSAGSSDIGVARFKSLVGSTLTVSTYNRTLLDNYYITIRRVIDPDGLVPYQGASAVLEDQTIAYSDQNTYYKPLALLGPPAVAFLESGSATVYFYSSSKVVAPGASLTTYAWTFPSGTPGTSAIAGTSGVPIAVTWTQAGQYYVKLTVTDSNGKSHTGYRPVFILNKTGASNVPFRKVAVDVIQGSQDAGGWTCSVKVYGTSDISTFPAKTMVVIFAEDYYGGGALHNIGGDYGYRQNIIFVGWIHEGSIQADIAQGFVTFQASGPVPYMDKISAKAANYISGTPADWHTLNGMTYDLIAYHIVTEHSTIDHLADVDLIGVSKTISKVETTEGNLRTQVANQVYSCVRSLIGSSRTGRIYARPNPQLQALASRTEANVLDTTNADIRDMVIIQELENKISSILDVSGYDSSKNAIYSLAPAEPWGTGQPDRITDQRADDQAELNAIAGYWEGYRNNPYPNTTIRWRGNYRIFDVAPPEHFRFNLPANRNFRGYTWTNVVMRPKQVRFQLKPGSLLAETDCEMDSIAAAGIAGEYPETPPTPPVPEFPPIEEPPVPELPPITPTDIPGKGNLIYLSSLVGVAKCVGAYGTNGTDGTPVWTNISAGMASTYVYGGINFDPFSKSVDHFTRIWAHTNAGLERCDGLPDSPVWSTKLTMAQAKALLGTSEADFTIGQFTPNVRQAGWIGVIACYYFTTILSVRHYKFFILYSTDNGETWQVEPTFWVQKGAGPLATDSIKTVRLQASAHVDGALYFITSGSVEWDWVDWRPTPQPSVFRRIGGTWSKGATMFMGGDTTHQGFLLFPYSGPGGGVYTNDEVAYMYYIPYEESTAMIGRTTSLFTPPWSSGYAGKAGASVGPSESTQRFPGNTYGPVPVFDMFDENNIVAFFPYGSAVQYYDGTGYPIWRSTTRGTTWTQLSAPTAGGRTFSGTEYGGWNLFMVPADHNILVTLKDDAANPLVFLSPNMGNSWVDIGLAAANPNGIALVLSSVIANYLPSIVLVDYNKS